MDVGTKIVIHLRPEDAEFANEATIKDVVKKYSNFVGTDVMWERNFYISKKILEFGLD